MGKVVKKVVIRVDGNSSIGLGHIYRGIALAEMLKDEFEVQFILKSSSTLSPVKEAGFDYLILPENVSTLEEPQWFNENIPKESIIILDGYEFNSAYQKTLKGDGFKLVYIDDLVKEHMYADLIINHSPGIKPVDYSAEPYTKFALGLKYAILRPAFLEAAKQKRVIDKIDTAFVCFGGSDIYDLTLKATKALLQIDQIKKINVVVGAAYKHKKIYALKEKQSGVNIFRNLSEREMLNVMQESNLAVIPSSSILYEVASVKLPVICGYYAENQKNIYITFIEKNIVAPVGRWQDLQQKQLIDIIKNFITSDFQQQIYVQQQLFDGKNKNRFLKRFNILKLELRNVSKKDVDLLYNWVNDNDVRRNAVDQNIVSYTNHVKWFNNVIKSLDTKIFILLFDDIPVGQIRFDYNEESNDYTIDYSIDNNFRGRGFGKEIVVLGINKLKEEVKKYIQIKAVVRKSNQASINVFRRLNFEIAFEDDTFFTFLLKI